MSKIYQNLFSPLTVGQLTFKNRTFGAPTTFYELPADGMLDEASAVHYAARARGGAAVVTLGESIVEMSTGKSHARQICIDDELAMPGLARTAELIHAYGAYASIELSHGGALSSPEFIGGKNAIGPSAYVDAWGDTVDEMSTEDIERITQAFGLAAARAKKCGFDMCMIHGGHGWLLHQFISPLTNFRTDEYGGCFENRMRFTLEVIAAVRKHAGNGFPIEFRFSADECAPGGYGLETGLKIARALDGKVELLHVSAGTQQIPYSAVTVTPSMFEGEAAHLELCAAVKAAVKTPVVAVAGFTDPLTMEKALSEGKTDAIAMARRLISDPGFPEKLRTGRENEIPPCMRCYECQGNGGVRINRCSVNPVIGRELREELRPAARKSLKILIAGGGPGGMMAAITAIDRGHRPILCEQDSKLGGHLSFADNADFKINVKRYKEYLARRVAELGVELRLNTTVDSRLISELKPDVVIAAVGAVPFVPPVPGIDGENVFVGAELTPDTALGRRVAVMGGGLIGCETAVSLQRKGHEVTVVEMLDSVIQDSGVYVKLSVGEELKACKILTGVRCTEITPQGVRGLDKQGAEVFVEADSVVVAAGMRARRAEAEKLRSESPRFFAIGDCARVGKIIDATRTAYDVVRSL